MLEVPKCAPEEALRALGRGFANFFAGRAKYPRFKQRGRPDTFRVDGKDITVDGGSVRGGHGGGLFGIGCGNRVFCG